MKAWGKEIVDPKLRRRVEAALRAAEGLEGDLRRDVPGPPSDTTQVIKAPPRRIRQSQKPLLNKLEDEYCRVFLDDKIHLGFTTIQGLRFKLANGVWYKPDFFNWPTPMSADKPVGIEVKGPHAFRGGFENLKMAAHQYPWIKWVLAWKQDDKWQEQVVLP